MENKNSFYVANVSTFPPRGCGIGSFAKDMLENLGTNNWITCPIVWKQGITKYSSNHILHIGQEIQQDNPASYGACAQYIVNFAKDLRMEGKDLGCFINHEYGIFAEHHTKDNAVRFLKILNEGRVATVIIGHTILYDSRKKEFPQKRDVMIDMIRNCDKFVCLTPSALRTLIDRKKYGAPRGKLIYIAHGIPEIDIPESRSELKRKYRFVNEEGKEKTVFTSVGFLSRSKGIEYIIEGFSKVLEKRPYSENLVYLIAGATHPDSLREEGEKYREELVALTKEKKISGAIITREEIEKEEGKKEKKIKITDLYGNKINNIKGTNIVFLNSHLEDYELLEIMKMSDCGVIGNLDEEQISSGPGAYWIGSSRITIATASSFFKDMEDEGIGLLVPFKNVEAFEDRMNHVLDLSHQDKEGLEFIASDFGAKNTWGIQGQAYSNVMGKIIRHKAGLREPF